ncbi:chemerin-like receptor 2 [Amia ocellicauda]|uniref:chemerin-like receptor 2 n=1 Tax=Amia ocellicauda TaxID=2972642 RepID=UPI003464479A|nr:GPR1 protein [Amia calva]
MEQVNDYGNISYEDYEYMDEVEGPKDHVQSEVLHIISVVVYSISFVLGIIGNGVVIWVIGWKQKKTINTIWLLNLAVADFVFVLFLPLSIDYVLKDFHWNFGKAFCKINSFVTVANMFASVFFLTVISVDLYISVMHCAWSERHRTLTKGRWVCAGVWVLAITLSIPSLVFRDTVQLTGKTVCFNNFHDTDIHLLAVRHITTVCLRMLFGFLLPFTAITVSSILLVVKMRNSSGTSSMRFSGFSRTATAIILAFFFCWAPLHVFSLMEISIHAGSRLHNVLRTGFPLATSLAFFNSCLNPILYVLTGKKIKKVIRKSCLEITKHALRDITQTGSDIESLSMKINSTEGKCEGQSVL